MNLNVLIHIPFLLIPIYLILLLNDIKTCLNHITSTLINVANIVDSINKMVIEAVFSQTPIEYKIVNGEIVNSVDGLTTVVDIDCRCINGKDVYVVPMMKLDQEITSIILINRKKGICALAYTHKVNHLFNGVEGNIIDLAEVESVLIKFDPNTFQILEVHI